MSAIAPDAAGRGPGERRGQTIAMFAGLIAANVLAWIWAWTAFGQEPALFGAAALAYAFGLRHAMDADHIAAIDNVVRKLLQDGRKAGSVGFFFSLGHSTVVVLAVLAIAFTASALSQEFAAFKTIGGVIGTGVSAAFLLIIGGANLLILRTTWRAFKQARLGKPLDGDHGAALGPLTRFFGPLLRTITRPQHMYALGFLFGLGFDTATEIGLLSVSASQASEGVSVWSIMAFPALFTAGMALADTADSTLMTGAYGWAFINPVRKLWYNLTITAASVAIAVFIGGTEALALIAGKLGLESGFWTAMVGLNESMANTGFAVVGLFIASWAASAFIYWWKGYDRLPLPAASSSQLQHSLAR
jgi:high-affinity nickel-transport protein